MRASARELGLLVPTHEAVLEAIADAPGAGDVVRVTLHEDLDAVRRSAGDASPVDLISLPGWYARGYRLREHKLTSHFHGVRGRALAISRGAGDALLVEESSGLVGEATNANVFALFGDRAVTPPVDGLLPGVTRALCLECFPLTVEQRPLELGELHEADGLLLTTSVRGLVPARSLDGSALAQPPGHLLAALREALDGAETAELLLLPLR
jgi:branched-subunit amino acid aminotransferase/4-amino-4-deoxychorismate lyase